MKRCPHEDRELRELIRELDTACTEKNHSAKSFSVAANNIDSFFQ